MATSYTTFCNGLADLVVTGVKRRLRYMPTQINSGDLPLQFVRLPQGNERPLTADGEGGWPAMTCDLVIVAEALQQSNAAEAQALTLTLVDALNTALRAVAPNTISRTKLRWAVAARQQALGETEYWTIIASVTGSG